jgi:predicted XRE-type DNA-binding protein
MRFLPRRNKFGAVKVREDGRLCAAPGCTRPARQYKRWCSKHEARFLSHGDPLAGRVENGAPLRWLTEHVAHQGDDCLIWPFAKSANGYGSIVFRGKRGSAHRAICILTHGEPPSPKHVAAHSCGRGHMGCVNPRHLSWKTNAENMADKKAHGTEKLGSQRATSRLTEEKVREIRSLLGSMSQSKVAARFGVARTTVADIARKRCWAWL